VATCMPDATATSIARQMAAAGNRPTDLEDGALSMVTERGAERIVHHSSRPAEPATERQVEQIVRPSNRLRRLGRPIPVRPANWTATVLRAQPAIRERPRGAPSNRAECRDLHREVTAAVHVWAVAAAAGGADYRTRTPRSRRKDFACGIVNSRK
jgi:hypothetical protein